jgi:hypothetical protein
MDPYDGKILSPGPSSDWLEVVRKQLGYVLEWSRRLDLAALVPAGQLASSGYCLAKPGSEYLAYSPTGKELTMDLTEAKQTFAVTWFELGTGQTAPAADIQGGDKAVLRSPFTSGDAVLHLKRAQ